MIKSKTNAQNHEGLVEIAEGIYWVGFYDAQSGLHCNPYLIVDHDEALVIDGGSRPDFATVMMKIMQTGIAPKQIQALVYQHYDPDLCGSIPNFEDIIRREDLKIISDAENLMFIRHYSAASRLVSLSKLKFEFYGNDRFFNRLKELKDQPVDGLVETVFKSLMTFGNNTEPKDDVSLLGLELKT